MSLTVADVIHKIARELEAHMPVIIRRARDELASRGLTEAAITRRLYLHELSIYEEALTGALATMRECAEEEAIMKSVHDHADVHTRH